MARIKFMYQPTDGVKFVLQPDLSTNNLKLKEAYAVVNVPKLKDWTLWAGQMNRPDYEVEYSSGQREVFERSRFIRTIYPGEKEIGIKIEYAGSKIPLKFQFMTMNGNFTGTQARDVDSRKDFMTRAVYSVKLQDAGISIDIGANGYYGWNQAKVNKYVLNSIYDLDSINLGDYLDKKWIGCELRIFTDILGGLAIKAEYAAGINSSAGSTVIPADATLALKIAGASTVKNFKGLYIYMIKNIGPKNQFVARYDYYDPNSKLSGNAAMNDVYYKTLTLAWQFYLNNTIRISLNYEIPGNEVNTTYPADLKDNVFGVRIQAKF
jgi:phosphate-selective porin